MNRRNHERHFGSCLVCLAALAFVTVAMTSVQASDEGPAPAAVEAVVQLGEAAARAAFGPVEPAGVTSYWDPDMTVSAYAIEYARRDDGSPVTVIASARRDDVPIIMMWRGLPKHSDPAVLAATCRSIESALGVVVSHPAVVFWLDTYELWAQFPEINPQTGQATICNLYTGQIATLEGLQAKWQNRQTNVLVGAQAATSGIGIASGPQGTAGRTAAQARYIEAQWAAAEGFLAGGARGAAGLSAQAPPHYTNYVSGVPNLNEQIPWDGRDWENDSQIVAAMDVLLFWDTRGYDRLVDGDDLDAVHGDLREAMLWNRGSTDPNTASGLREFINGLSYTNQYSFLVELFDMWASPPYAWPSFTDCQREIDSGRPALLGVMNYTDDPTNPTDFDYRDHTMCAVGYFLGYPFSDRTSTEWVVVHDNWGGGDSTDPYRLDDEPFIDWNRATDSLIRVQPSPFGNVVTYPSAADIAWRCGETQSITWSGFTGSQVKIELYKGASLERTIRESTDNDGSYAWTVPGTQATGSDYRIRITSISSPSQSDDSDNAFTISDLMQVVYPTASGITWDRGSSYEITWTGFTTSYVRIELCRRLAVERTIVSSTGNSGSYTWAVPADQTIGSDYRIKISSTSDASQWDYSDNDFAIADVPQVLYPTASGIAMGRSIAYTITWDGFSSTFVTIDLYKGSRQYSTIERSASNTGSYAWTVPGDTALGADYRIKIASTSDASQWDYSDNPFEIKDVGTVTYPTNAGVTWRRGETPTITWAGFVGSTVRIDLYKGGSLHRTITSSTSNDGSHAWTVPSSQTLGADFKIRITSADLLQSDDSDNVFTIADPRVTYPTDRGITWKVSDSYRITWTGFVDTSVRIELYQGRTLVRTIAWSAPNTDSYTWTVPSDQTPGSDFTIRISATSDASQYDDSDNVFAITNPRVTYPTDAGVTWRLGEARTIAWTGFNGAGVKIELYKGSTLNRTITSSTSNDGSYTWTVPADQTTGADFKIRITSTSDSTQFDDSDNYFAIADPRVTYPTDPGVAWKVGESRTITWTGFVGSSVRIELYLGRTLNRTIASSTTNDGSYAWTIPSDQTPGSDFTIRVASTSDASQYDDSDNAFAITNPRVTYPTDRGITWKVGETRTITWSGFSGSAVMIELYKSSTLNRTIASSTSNSGSYSWTVPGDQTLGSDFKIRITSTSDRSQYDDSDNYFTIADPRVTYPTDPGITWKVGDSVTIAWTGFVGSAVKIDLYKGSTLSRTIASSTSNDGSYSWTVPADQTPGSDFKVRITCTSDALQSDDSDNYVTIMNPRVTYPTDAGVTWGRGGSYTITWDGFIGRFVAIELYKGGLLNRTLDPSADNDGAYTWTVPADQVVGTDFKIRVTLTSDPSQSDESDNPFTISDEPCPPRPVALWRFEPGAFTDDSVSTNYLDNDGAALETTDRKEGNGCAYLRAYEKDSLIRYDDHLAANFPTKSGSTSTTMTLCFWMKPKSFPFNATVISKYQIATDTRSWRLYLGAIPGNYMKLGLGRGTGGDFTDYSFNQTSEQLVANHWYHVAFVYRSSDRYYHVRIWDDTDGVVRVNREGTATAPMAITNAPLVFGNTPLESMYFDGLLDEVAVFNEVLSTSQIDKVRRGDCRLY
ncbi:MAG: hypothetical protein JW955_25205 [Sedimentisphaerales bacterium]|nr:hypothetical protein [Sedimentisphaerales bacterium]